MRSAYDWIIRHIWTIQLVGLTATVAIQAIFGSGTPTAILFTAIVVFAPVVVLSALMMAGSVERAKEVKPPSGTSLVFSERGASANSSKNLLTSFAGAHRLATVQADNEQVYVYPTLTSVLFSIGDIYDLAHRIPIRSIVGVERSGGQLRIRWEMPGRTGDVRLGLSDPEKLERVINRNLRLTNGPSRETAIPSQQNDAGRRTI